MSEKDGGSAFPWEFSHQKGMTLRDYFAAMAMQGDWACQGSDNGAFTGDSSNAVFEGSAKLYYRMADAMLKERVK